MARGFGAILTAGLLALAAAGAAAAQTVSPAPVAELGTAAGKVTGTVLDAAGAPVAGASVSLLERTAVSDANGRFSFGGVPLLRRTDVNIRIVDRSGDPVGCTTLSVPVRFYPLAASSGAQVAVTTASPDDDTPAELHLAAVGSAEIEAFCSRCHGPNPCTQSLEYGAGGEKPRSLGGIEAREDELEALQERLARRGGARESFASLRYRDAHPQADMAAATTPPEDGASARYRLPPGLALLADKRTTCDTCHTRHIPTGSRSYTVMEFETANTLCNECHL
jgi:hypothetical protein